VTTVEHNQITEMVKHFLELLTSGFVTQAGRELFTAINKRLEGQPKAEKAISQLQAAPENSPNAVRTLEALLEAEIIRDDIYAARLQQLMETLENERSQKIGTELTATESVDICNNKQSLEGSSTGSQVLGSKIETPNIKISGSTQSQKKVRGL
jgi:hypothetical protein